MEYDEEPLDWSEHSHDEDGREEYEAEVAEKSIVGLKADLLRSYYVTNPNLAGPAHGSLVYAQSLEPSYPTAALVFAVTATELAIKAVLLKPIVFGLIHTEALASFVSDLTTQHTGMERFQTILTEILGRFGGVDLKTFQRNGSTLTLWNEIVTVQKARNAVVHQGKAGDDANAPLAIAVAATLLNEIFPSVLAKLGLHLHEPGVVCAERHFTRVAVTFAVPNGTPVNCSVDLAFAELDLSNPPDQISGNVPEHTLESEVLVGTGGATMWIVSTIIKYSVRFTSGSQDFTGTRVRD
jgi:hypothetical protein